MDRKGRQEPTTSFTLPYTVSKGAEAAELYNSTGKTAQEWQEALLFDIMAVNEDGLWTHVKFGYSVPRRNGKNEVVAIREMWGLKHGENILHTAHRSATSSAAWLRLYKLLGQAGLKEKEDFIVTRKYGLETIEMIDGSGGKCSFRTRTSKGGLGEGFDLLIIDEAQEYTDDQESALKYTVSDSGNPQTLLCGTPPTPISSGTVFTKLRKKILCGEALDDGWAEWSVPEMTDPEDIDAWYETNPSLGTILTERKIREEIGEDSDDFNIQRLGLWIRYNQKSEIPRTEWDALMAKRRPKFSGQMCVGIKYNKNGATVSLSVALFTVKQDVFIECIDCRSVRDGNEWIIDFCRNPYIAKIVIDGNPGNEILADELKKEKIRTFILPKVGEVTKAGKKFMDLLYAGTLKHKGQPGMVTTVTNCEKRAIGSNGGFGFNSTKGDISIMDSAILAAWARLEFKDRDVSKKKKRVSY